MRPRSALPVRLGAAFSVGGALEAGVGRGRLRDPGLQVGVRGARARPLDAGRAEDHPAAMWRSELRRRAVAYAQVMPEHAFLVGRAAAVIWDADVPVPRDGSVDVEVAVPHPHRAPRTRGVRGRQMRAHLARSTVLDGIRVATPPVMWASLARQMSHRDLVAVADQLLRVDRMPGSGRILRPALASREDLAAELVQRPGRAALVAALDAARPGSASVPETHLRLAICEAGLPEPELDVDVYDAHGRLLGCSEMLFRAHAVVGEYEGAHHRTSRAQWQRDIEKYEAYAAEGLTVVRITADDLYPQPGRAVARLGRALEAAGWHPTR